MEASTKPSNTHIGRKISRIRELRDIKQEHCIRELRDIKQEHLASEMGVSV